MPKTIKVQINGLSGELDLQADYFKPTPLSKKTLLVCLPGGGANKAFFDLGHYDDFDYSFTSRMSALGYAVLTLDHPGTATNPLPEEHPFLTPRQSAIYIGHAISGMTAHMGTYDRIIGIGHSMGGMMITLLQALKKPFDAIGLLGSSAGGLEWGLDDHEKAYIDQPEAFNKDLEALTLRKFKTSFPPGMGGPTGKSITFGGENEAVTARLREISCQLFAAGGMMSMTRGSFIKEVEAIDTPMFFGFGDQDIGIPPEDAPKAYINATSTTLHVMENTGHNSFAFKSLETLCERLDLWLASIKT